MLLFGGNLTGVKRLESTVSKPPSIQRPPSSHAPEAEPQVLTPHTDVLHRLTNHELRLLEELERTRSKLQAEWRVKLSELQENDPEVSQSLLQHGVPTVEQLTQLFLVPANLSARPESGSRQERELKTMMRTRTMSLNSSQKSKRFLPHKKARGSVRQTSSVHAHRVDREPSLPRIRTNFDVLPILTSAAETPFEVGLDSPSASPTQHVLPIFKLPMVNVNATASALAAKEIEMLEEDRYRKQASEALGLSLEEIEALEAELRGQSRPKLTGIDSAGLTQKAPLRSPLTRRGIAPLGTNGQKKKKSNNHVGRGQAKGSARSSDTEQRGAALRKELESALYNVQHLTRLVKDDIFSAQKICPASELRTSLYFKRWGKDKVETIFRRLLFNMQGIAFGRWRHAIAYEKQQEKLQAYLMYKGSKKLDVFLLNRTHRKLRQAWTKWWSDIVHLKALERAELEVDSVRAIQRAFRGHRGRMFARLIRRQRRLALETQAASKIQRMFRGSIARNFFRLKQLNKRRQAAATRIQCLARYYLARRLLKDRQEQRKQCVAASRIQALYRGRRARREIAGVRRQQRVTQAAVLIQRRYRGRLGRAKFLRQQIERHRSTAAMKIQTTGRGFLARRLLARLREERKALLARQNAAATTIQKVYRGHRARLGTQLKLLALKEKNKLKKRAAIKIQTMVRCRQARLRVARMREARLVGMVALARLWVEYWSEDTSQWFYYNTETGQAIWAPPATGYTKADGLLVLQSGKIIENPPDGQLGDTSLAFPSRKKSGEGEGEPKAADEATLYKHEHADDDDEDGDRLCVECEEEDALRKCDQCEDVYCDACYHKLHSSAKRETHTWKAIGTMRCIECEKMKATRWCAECQDPYCLGCFTIIHSKGNKSAHQWTDMATFRKQKKHQEELAAAAAAVESTQTYEEFMRSADYQYVTELETEEPYPYQDTGAASQDPYASQYSSNSGAASAEEWTTQYDENSGRYFYYNASTGESRWA